jgi:hypothetical protein
MIGYPYIRDDKPLAATALRLAGAEDWDPDSDRLLVPSIVPGEPVRLEARVIADLGSVYSIPLLPRRQALTLIAVARCPATRWSRVLQEWSIPARSSETFEVSPVALELDWNRIAGQVKLSLCLCLAADRAAGQGFFARRRLNILAEKRFRVLLGGVGGGLTEWVSFREKELPAGLWNLRLPEADLGQPVDALRLWLNKDVESFHRLMTASAGQMPETRIAHRICLRVIAVEFLHALLMLGFSTPDDDLPESLEDVLGTCWSAVLGVCAKVFADEWDSGDQLASFTAMRERYRDQPNEVETRVQAHLRMARLMDSFDALNM